MPTEEEMKIQTEAEKVSEESKVHDSVRHPFKYPTDLMKLERKNSLTFGSHTGAKVLVIYHTFIETCKMCSVSTLIFFKEFFKAIMQRRTDYENLLPMIIDVKKY